MYGDPFQLLSTYLFVVSRVALLSLDRLGFAVGRRCVCSGVAVLSDVINLLTDSQSILLGLDWRRFPFSPQPNKMALKAV